MTLKHEYDSEDQIPEQYRELYTQKGDKWEVTGITGLATQANVRRLESALEKERNDHKETKGKLQLFSDLGDLDTVQKQLDRIPELEAAAKGKLDENELEELAQRRAEGIVRSQLAPVERQLKAAERERDELRTANQGFTERENRRRIHDEVRSVAGDLRPEALEDALFYAERVMEISADGAAVTRDGVGVTPGLSAKDLLADLKPKRPHWWKDSQGGGAPGSNPRGGPGAGADNPWSREGWNMTKQGQYIREHGAEKAEAAAKAAGSKIGALRPTAKAE